MRYLIYKDWIIDNTGTGHLTWMVEVGPFESEKSADLYVETVKKKISVNSGFISGIVDAGTADVLFGVRFHGIFSNAEDSGKFADNLDRLVG